MAMQSQRVRLVRLALPYSLICLLAGMPGAIAAGATGAERRAALEEPGQLEARIAELIEQLGSQQYARRELAQERLRKLGLVAFDALLDASHHDDVEIALRARYLVRSMPVQWSVPEDTQPVRSILRNYSQASREERRNRMQQLAALPEEAGILALCRLMRFESDVLLSKEAALFAMSRLPEDDQLKKELAKNVGQTVGLSNRPAAVWLRTYARTLINPEDTFEDWQVISNDEVQTFARFPERSDRRIVRDLLRWHADLLRHEERQDESLLVIGKILDLIEGRRSELFDFVDWALERKAWYVVDEVAGRFPNEFYKHSILVYRLAEAQLKRGEKQLADTSAQLALEIDPQHPDSHNVMAEYLTTRLLYDWAEQEYRFVIDSTEPSPNNGLHMEARFFLSDMLFDLERPLDAADVLQGAIDAIDENLKLIQPTLRAVSDVRALLYYYYAIHYGEVGDQKKQIEYLEKAFETSKSNPDILIAMYRVKEPEEEWRLDMKKKLDSAKGALRDRIRNYERVLASPPSETSRLDAMDQLARASNELAWLISNTEGDLDAALRHSLKSLKLKPGAFAYLDTLGRCYFARQEFEEAVECQTKAVEKAPYLQQISRQLKLFKQALKEQQSKEA